MTSANASRFGTEGTNVECGAAGVRALPIGGGGAAGVRALSIGDGRGLSQNEILDSSIADRHNSLIQY